MIGSLIAGRFADDCGGRWLHGVHAGMSPPRIKKRHFVVITGLKWGITIWVIMCL